MHKKLSVIGVVALSCCLSVLFAFSVGGKNVANKAARKHTLATTKIVKDLKSDEINQASQNTFKRQPSNITQVEVYSTDFEGPDGEWTPFNLNTDGSGNTFTWVDDNANSPTHSWHVPDDVPMSAGEAVPTNTWIVSPPIDLPTDVAGEPLTNLLVSYMFDAFSPNTVDAGFVYDVWDAHVEVPYPGDNLWHTSAQNAHAGMSWFCGLESSGTYTDNTRQELRTPALDLSTASGAVMLSFKNFDSIEDDFDYGYLEVSADGGASWATLDVYSEEKSAVAYTDAIYDISAYASGQTIVRWRFESDGGYQSPFGWHIDNIEIKDDATTYLFDDGGDTATELIAVEHPLAFIRMHYDYDQGGGPTPNWQVEDNTTIFNGSLSVFQYAGLTVRFALRVSTDGWNRLGLAPGRGIYLDDFRVEAIGRPPDDLTATSVDIPFPARVGDALTFALNVTNTGSTPQSNFQWQGTIINMATGAQVATVVGQNTAVINPGESLSVPSVTRWTPTVPGIYRVRAFHRLAVDGDRSNDTTLVANDDANGFGGGDARYSPFVVCEQNVLFSASLWDLPADPTVATLLTQGFQLRSNSAPGVVTWQNTNSAVVPAANVGVDYSGAYILFDSVGAGRPQDEELIIPNLDFSAITSNATLAFKGLGVLGFTWSRFTVGVSNDGGATWQDVFLRQGGTDPQTGIVLSGPAFFTVGQRPAALNITRWAAGYSNVSIRFRYEGLGDGDYTLWNVSVCGRGVQAATLTGVADIPMDQGKQVRVSWNASPNDGQIAGVPISSYGVWRKVSGTNKAGETGGEVIRVDNRLAMLELANSGKLAAGSRVYDEVAAQAWDFIASVPAHRDPDYGYVAPTLHDGVSTCFIVSAHTANPAVFANSNEVCGTSTDDLAPNAPSLMAEAQSGFVQLGWTEPDNEEAASYNVYRRLATEPSFGDAIASSDQIEFQDDTIDRNTSYIYAVTAVDFAGNESAFSNEAPVVTTAVAGRNSDRIPTEFALEQNHPNPFNPTTMINYQLPKNAQVRLTIFNSLGQQVRTLVDGELSAGYHQTLWDARDNAGRLVGSGIYMYIIEAGDFVQTKKMVLMK